MTVSEELDFLKIALALSGNCAPVMRRRYCSVSHPAISYYCPRAGVYENRYGGQPMIKGKPDPAKLHNLFSQLQALKARDYQALQFSTERLIRSRMIDAEADRAIDLGIVLQCLLLYCESGAGAKGELEHKTGTKGAWLASRDVAERENIFRILSKAYDLRSKAVHSGFLNAGKERPTLDEADKLCSRMLALVASKGYFPDWRKLDLGLGDEAW